MTQTTIQTNSESRIIRTERGLSIDGTRMMLYDVMDYFTIGYPRDAIRDHLLLTDAQIDAALHYIHEHRAEVESRIPTDPARRRREPSLLGGTPARASGSHAGAGAAAGKGRLA